MDISVPWKAWTILSGSLYQLKISSSIYSQTIQIPSKLYPAQYSGYLNTLEYSLCGQSKGRSIFNKAQFTLTTNRFTRGLGFSAWVSVEFIDSNLALRLLVESRDACSESSMVTALFTDCFSESQLSNLAARALAWAVLAAWKLRGLN